MLSSICASQHLENAKWRTRILLTFPCFVSEDLVYLAHSGCNPSPRYTKIIVRRTASLKHLAFIEHISSIPSALGKLALKWSTSGWREGMFWAKLLYGWLRPYPCHDIVAPNFPPQRGHEETNATGWRSLQVSLPSGEESPPTTPTLQVFWSSFAILASRVRCQVSSGIYPSVRSKESWRDQQTWNWKWAICWASFL